MGVTNYLSINGRIVSELRSGTDSDYIHDSLGSLGYIVGPGGNISDRYLWWPYGDVLLHSGASATPFGFLGALGYYTDAVGSSIYVRVRHYNVESTAWLQVDPLYPQQLPFAYVGGASVSIADPSGMGGLFGWQCPNVLCWPCEWWPPPFSCSQPVFPAPAPPPQDPTPPPANPSPVVPPSLGSGPPGGGVPQPIPNSCVCSTNVCAGQTAAGYGAGQD